MKRLLLVGLLALGGLSLFFHQAHAAFNPNLLIDDSVFNDTTSMNAAQIDAWLNSNFPNSCISTNHGFSAADPTGYNPSQGFIYGGPVSAGHVIYDAAQAYGLNPEVLLTTLQKEESLVVGDAGCSPLRYSASVGYGCPDGGTTYDYNNLNPAMYYINGTPVTSISGTCVNDASRVGFSQQIIRAAWLLKFGQQRSLGNTGWAVIKGSWDNSDDPPTCYGGPMTEGNLKRCQDSTPTFFDGYTTIDGSATHMDTGATAALYWYTPHFSGNQSFVNIFAGWFGSTISAGYYSCHDATNVSGQGTGAHIVRRNTDGKGRVDNLALVLMNDTNSSCVEAHTWAGSSYKSWYQNTATNLPAVNPADDEVISADIDGSGRDEIILVKLRNTGSGKIEIHTWDTTNQHWYSNIATNYPAVDPSQYRVIAADLNGDGKDELVLVKYLGGASGKVEVFPWSADYQNFTAYIATNLPSLSPINNEIIAANTATDGGANDKLVLVKYQGGASGKIEVHTWNPGEQSWYSNIATNYPAVDPSSYQVMAADVDGHGKEQLLLVHYNFNGGTASGKVEIFPWSPGYQSFSAYTATNLSLLNVEP
jgi:hypothetical protein